MNKQKIIIGLIIIIIIFVTGYFINDLYNDYQVSLKEIEKLKNDNEELKTEATKLQNNISDLKNKNNTMSSEIIDLREKLVETQDGVFELNEFHKKYIERNGFTVEAVLEDLRTQDDLIPFEGVLGGTMRWWPEESQVLTNRYVLGYFEDGHILGYGLLKYEFEGESISWELIDAYLDE